MEPYTTGTKQRINVHDRNDDCAKGCVIHAPTEHAMRDFPTHWRDDRGLMERLCPHGVGHPDPDHLAFVERMRGPEAAGIEGIHGCCGCCG